MGKEIKINGKSQLYKVLTTNIITQETQEHICTIEHVGRDSYYVYSEEGEGVSVAELDTIDIIELMTTGSIEQTYLTITMKM